MRTLQRLSWLIIACSILGASAPAFAQGGRAEINGTVVDAQKAVLPGATVTATNEDTGLVRESVADATGRFVMPSLLPGTYTVKAELSGFQPMVRTGMVVRVGEELTVTLTLPIAGVAETLTVTAESPLVEATSSKIGTNVTSAEIDGLPSANRSQFSLMQTIPGLVPVLQVGSFEGGQFSANGQATTNNLFLVDGQAGPVQLLTAGEFGSQRVRPGIQRGKNVATFRPGNHDTFEPVGFVDGRHVDTRQDSLALIRDGSVNFRTPTLGEPGSGRGEEDKQP